MKYVRLLRKAAGAGDVRAMWTLGDAYVNGFFFVGNSERIEHVDRNNRLAKKWLKSAASNGCTGAMLSLASLYTQGVAFRKKNILAAIELEKRAWRHGEVLAANNVAISYSCLEDKRKCFYWLKKSYIATGDGFLLALALAVGYGVRPAPKRAMRLLEKIVHEKSCDVEDRAKARKLIALIIAGQLPTIATPISRTFDAV